MIGAAGHFSRIGIIGGSGWLGSAIVRSLLRSGVVAASELTCSFRSGIPANAPECRWTKDNAELVAASDIVILSVRPQDWPALEIDAHGKLVISVMAGIGLDDIRRRTHSSRIARALPNAAAELGYSYTPIYVETDNADDVQAVRSIFEACGAVDVVNSETHIDYLTTVSGSGPAFPALLAEAMMKAAIAHGIDPGIALRAAQQVIIGAGRLQEAHGIAPAETVRAFIDYRGTTAAAIETMREHGFDQAVGAGLKAAYERALALAGKSGKDKV